MVNCNYTLYISIPHERIRAVAVLIVNNNFNYTLYISIPHERIRAVAGK